MNKKPKKGEYLETLLRFPKSIFSIQDVALMWGEESYRTISMRLSKYVKAGKLIRVRRGLYAKNRDYDRFELATRIYTPSYISFETVLTRRGVSFQYYGNIFVASYLNREIVVGDSSSATSSRAMLKDTPDKQKITFIRMKDYVLSNTTGIESKAGYSIASKERAFLDRIYVSKDYHFDNLASLDWDMVFKILPIYHNKRLEKKVKKHFKDQTQAKAV